MAQGRPSHRRRARGPSRARLDALIAEATVDAYGLSEQATGLFTMIEEHLRCPFLTTVLGRPVTVRSVDLNAGGQIVARCISGRHRQAIPILDLPLPLPAPPGAEWIAAYRHWLKIAG